MTVQTKASLLAAGVILAAGCVGSVGDETGPASGKVPGAGTTGVRPGSPGAQPGSGPGTGGANAPGMTGAGGTGQVASGGNPTSFTCNASAVAPSEGWRKLTTSQYRNTLRDLLAFTLRDPGQGANALAALAPSASRLPVDERQKLPQDLHGSYRRLDQEVEQVHVDATYEVALAAAAYLTVPTRLGVVAGSCATDTNAANDADCLTAFITKFGERALRRALAPEDMTFYRGFYGASTTSDPAGYADVIAAFLTAPQFLYQVEHGEAAVAAKPTVFSLSAFEVASRLAYQFWDTMPDTDLFEAARSGALKTPDGFARQVDRIFADPRTRVTMDDFYRDWLKLDDVKPLDARNTDAIFKAFAGTDLPKASLRTAMIDDVVGMARYYTWDKPAGFDELLSSNLSFAKVPELAKIYNLPAWDGMGPPPAFPDGQRPGFLTRGAFLATGSANTRPVMKGVFIRETVLCDEIPPPPNNANANPPELSPMLSTRQVVEAITEIPGSACAACHLTVINPLGFPTENFDSLGRLRAEQRLFNDKGVEIGKAAINTRTVPRVTSDDTSPASNAADLMRLIAKSGKAQACFVRNYFRFSFARWDDPAADGCVLERLKKVLDGKGTLGGVLKEVALAAEFQQRTIK